MNKEEIRNLMEETLAPLRKRIREMEAVIAIDGRLPLSIEQAAAYLGFSTGHMYKLRFEGKGPKAIGRSTKYMITDLQAWLDSRAGMDKADRIIQDHRAEAKKKIKAA